MISSAALEDSIYIFLIVYLQRHTFLLFLFYGFWVRYLRIDQNKGTSVIWPSLFISFDALGIFDEPQRTFFFLFGVRVCEKEKERKVYVVYKKSGKKNNKN